MIHLNLRKQGSYKFSVSNRIPWPKNPSTYTLEVVRLPIISEIRFNTNALNVNFVIVMGSNFTQSDKCMINNVEVTKKYIGGDLMTCEVPYRRAGLISTVHIKSRNVIVSNSKELTHST